YHCHPVPANAAVRVHPAPARAVARAPGAASRPPTSRTLRCFAPTELADCCVSPVSVRADVPGDSADCGSSTGSLPARGSPAAALPDPGTPERTVPTVDGRVVPDRRQPLQSHDGFSLGRRSVRSLADRAAPSPEFAVTASRWAGSTANSHSTRAPG